MVGLRSATMLALATAVVLAACAGQQTGPTFASFAQAAGPPKAGDARIVVMRREKGFVGIGDRGVPVKLDDRPLGDLMTGTFVSLDVPAGPHQLSSELWDLPGVSRHDFNAAAGRTYYFVARVDDSVKDIYMASAFGGLIGRAIATTATNQDHGGITLAPLDEAAARQAMGELRQAQ
jgi:hypothetical protein